MGVVCWVNCLMMLEERYTQEGAVQGGGGELRSRGAIMKFRNQLKVLLKQPGGTSWEIVPEVSSLLMEKGCLVSLPADRKQSRMRGLEWAKMEMPLKSWWFSISAVSAVELAGGHALLTCCVMGLVFFKFTAVRRFQAPNTSNFNRCISKPVQHMKNWTSLEVVFS